MKKVDPEQRFKASWIIQALDIEFNFNNMASRAHISNLNLQNRMNAPIPSMSKLSILYHCRPQQPKEAPQPSLALDTVRHKIPAT